MTLINKSIEQPSLTALPPQGMFMDGKYYVDPSGNEVEHIYPATGKPTRKVALAGPDGVDAAVKSARAAFPLWKDTPAAKRREILLNYAALLRKYSDRLTDLIIIENGMSRQLAKTAAGFAATWFEHYAGYTDKMAGGFDEVIPNNSIAYHINEPYGVVAILMPFNAPVMNIGLTAAAALAVGNCVVLKPSYLIPFSAPVMGEIFIEAGGPPGVFNIVPCQGSIGNFICEHPGVNKIHLTGSVSAGKKIMQAASKNLTPVGLELGGKSPSVVFDDADIESVVNYCVSAIWKMAGQVCGKQARVLVQSGVYDKVVEMVRAASENIVVGDPNQEETELGPVISQDQLDEIMGFIERGNKSDTARLILGGERLGGTFGGGFYVAPTIYADVDPSDELFTDEVFGPVLTFTKFETEEEAIKMANDSEFGLVANIFTQDIKRANRVGLAMEAGNVVLNGGMTKTGGGATVTVARPFGGFKNSGFGRVGGEEGIREFTHTKTMVTILI